MRESIQDVARQTPSQGGPSCHFFLSFLPVFLSMLRPARRRYVRALDFITCELLKSYM